MSFIPRHRTALHRKDLSRPLRIAAQDGLLPTGTRVFDYGCGHGDDIAHLLTLGFAAEGWDPAHRPQAPLRPAELVNLGYVLNVIEYPAERSAALQKAWALTERVLLVAARLDAEADALAEAPVLHDGHVTSIGTFQKLYGQDELRIFLDFTLNVNSVAAAPGVFYVFRDESERQSFLASRYRRVAAPRLRLDEMYKEHQALLTPLLDFLCHRGRLPDETELPDICDPALMLAPFGTLSRAARVVSAAIDESVWAQVREQRTQDLLIYLALSRFSQRPRLGSLPPELQRDMRAFFTSFQAACELADELLQAAGNMQFVDRLCRKSRVGKSTPVALYVHVSALPQLHPVLRLYEGCARNFVGNVEGASVIKLHRRIPQVSYLFYPDFDDDPHPKLYASLVLPLQTFRMELRHYSQNANPPILHRKEDFVDASYPLREKFRRLTKQEERFGLYDRPERIGTQAGWKAVLAENKVTLRGHRVINNKGER